MWLIDKGETFNYILFHPITLIACMCVYGGVMFVLGTVSNIGKGD